MFACRRPAEAAQAAAELSAAAEAATRSGAVQPTVDTLTERELVARIQQRLAPAPDWLLRLVTERPHKERAKLSAQVRRYVEPAVGIRGWDYHWPSQSMDPERLVGVMHDLGIDLSPWGL